MHVCKSWDIARQVQGGREIRTCMFLTRAMRQRAAELPLPCGVGTHAQDLRN